MTVKQLIDLLSCVKVDTNLGIQVGNRKTDLKSMDAIGDTLYLTGDNWAPTAEEIQEYNTKLIITSISHFAKVSKDDIKQ